MKKKNAILNSKNTLCLFCRSFQFFFVVVLVAFYSKAITFHISVSCAKEHIRLNGGRQLNVGEQGRQRRGKGQKRWEGEEVDSSINTLRKGMRCKPAGAKVSEIHWRSRWYLDLFQVLQREKKERLRMETVGRFIIVWWGSQSSRS